MVPAAAEDRKRPDKSEKMDLAPVAPESFRRVGFIERWRFWLPGLLVAGFVLWRGADAWLQDIPGQSWHSPGHLASAHALYEAKCSACHAAFTPLSDATLFASGFGWNNASAAKCSECHESFNHHAKEDPNGRATCTACHLEHRGQHASLVRTPDAQCTSCHASSSKRLMADTTTTLLPVSHFDKENHPEFRPAVTSRSDPRRLKFNHKLHLTSGFRRTEQGEAFTLAMVDPRYRSLYGRAASLKEAVRLECKSCHQLDSRDFSPPPEVLGGVPRNAVRPARPPGATMLPIVYEQHCQACHPLTFERADPADKSWQPALAPHRQQPAEIHHFLEAYYLDQLQRSKSESLRQPFPPLPGKPLSPDRRILADVLGERVQRAEKQLYLGKKVCGECHYLTPSIGRAPTDRLADLKIAPTLAPEVWYQKADFTHTPHRLLDCLACHPGADAQQELDRPSNGEVLQRPLLPGIDNCLSCHSSSIPGGGARQDCVACHRYHNGDHPLRGPGATARAGPHSGKRSIREFIDATGP